MKRILTFLVLLTIAFTAYSQQSLCPATITHQGVTYNTMWVGGNCWMKENLRSTQYGTQSNADHLTPSFVVYPNIPTAMGYLYSWYAAVGLPEGSTDTPPKAISERVQGICPNEWMIPTSGQLELLFNSGEPRNNEQAYWVYGAVNPPSGTNGFNMYPAGYYNTQTHNFYEYKLAGYLWALNYNGTSAECGIFPFDCRANDIMSMNKYNMLSVRCVKAPPYGVEEITACDSYTWNGVTYTETGRYVGEFPNDSVSTLLLTINYTTYGTLDIVACDSYYWDLTDKTYLISGTHMATIENVLGCDSIVTLNLDVRYSNSGTDVQNHCDEYTWIDGITYTETTNEPTYTVTNVAGCDSLVTLNLTIRKMTTGTDLQSHCDEYTWMDGITYTASTNEPTFTITNAAGCDSVVTLNLTIREKTYGTDVQEHCDTYTWIDGVTYTASTNLPVFTITNNAGCDSIVTLNLTIKYSTSSPAVSVTEYNTYTWNGETYTTSGIYTATLVNSVGCDSTATLDLTILYRFPITYNLNGGALPATYADNYVQGVGATLPIPVKANNRFDGWYDNAAFTGAPVTVIGNSASGDKQYWALWTVLEKAVGSHLLFAGTTSSYVVVSNTAALNPTTAITLEAWINPTEWRASSQQGKIISKNYPKGYELTCGADGVLRFAVPISSTWQEVLSTSGALTLNEWQHVAGVYDGTTMKIYRNGVLLNTKNQTGTMTVNSNRLEIGRDYDIYERFYGRIDEVRIWNAALDQANLQTWYNKSLTPTHANYSNLVAYYEFDNTTNAGTLVATVGPNGTITSAPYVSGGSCDFTSTSSNAVIGAASSVIASHQITSPILVDDINTNVQILRFEVNTSLNDAHATQFVLTTNGTTNVSDIANAKLWYTGTSANFDTTTPFGTPVVNPNGTFTFTGNQAIYCGVYYFWLTYDVSPTAVVDNVLDATLTSCTIERLAITPLVSAPIGNRAIKEPCQIHTLQIKDFYGDSWNGGAVSLFVNNIAIFTDITITVGSSSNLIKTWFNYPFAANIGDTIRVIRTIDGTYPSEMRVQVLAGNNGMAIISEIQPTPAPGSFAIAGCYTTITTSISSNGTIAPAAGIVPALLGFSKSFIYKPSVNYYTDSVIVNGINNSAAALDTIYTFTNVTTPQTLRVTFKTNVITASAGANGTISPSGSTNVGRNGTKTFTFTPNKYYFLDSLIVNGINIPDSIAGKSYTFTNVNAPQTIRGTFKTNFVTPTLITPPSIVGTPVQDNALSTLSFTGGLVEHNGVGVPGVYSWVAPTTLLTTPGNYSVKFSPTDTNSYFTFNFDIDVNFQISYLTVAGSGTTITNQYIPLYGYYMDNPENNYVLYPESMLTPLIGKTFTKMVFYSSNLASKSFTSPVTISLGATTLTEITTNPTAVNFTPTTVYTGTVSVANNKVTIELTSPYEYNGGNLIFNFTKLTGGTCTSSSTELLFVGVNRTNSSRYTYGSYGTPTSINFIPKTTFNFLP